MKINKQIENKNKKIRDLFYVYEFFVRIYVSTKCIQELELWPVMNHQVGAGMDPRSSKGASAANQ